MEYFRCDVCNFPSKVRCGICFKAFYCCESCQRYDWPAHRRVCRNPRNLHTDRFEMYLEDSGVPAGEYELTPDGIAEFADQFKESNIEKYNQLKASENLWRISKYEQKFKNIIDINKLDNHSINLRSAKRLLNNFSDYLINPKTRKRLTKETLEKIVRKWDELSKPI